MKVGIDPISLAAIAAAAKAAAGGAATGALQGAAVGTLTEAVTTGKVTGKGALQGAAGGAVLGAGSSLLSGPEQAAIQTKAAAVGEKAAARAATPQAARSIATTAAEQSVEQQVAARTATARGTLSPAGTRTPVALTRDSLRAGAGRVPAPGDPVLAGTSALGRVRGAVAAVPGQARRGLGKLATKAGENKLNLAVAGVSAAAPLLLGRGGGDFKMPQLPSAGGISRGAALRREEERRRLRLGRGRRSTILTRGRTLGRANIGTTALLGG